MTSKPLKNISTRNPQTPQRIQADPREVVNNTGGYVFKISDENHLHRFLTLGTEGGTYYVKQAALTRDNANTVIMMAEASDPCLIQKITEISTQGRAPKQDPGLFALAAAAGLGDTEYRQSALDVLPRVARTGSALLTFAGYAEQFRGWGPQLIKGVARWYTGYTWRDSGQERTPEQNAADLAYQLLKYKQRGSWSHRDLLRLTHRRPSGKGYMATDTQKMLFNYIHRGDAPSDELVEVIPLIGDAYKAHQTRKVSEWVKLVKGNQGLSWEMLPSEALNESKVLTAMLLNGNIPAGAILRELPRLTRNGVLTPLSDALQYVTGKLTDSEVLVKARIHPVSMMIAMAAYTKGHSIRGESSWTPVQRIIDTLNDGFYAAFPAVEPTGKRVLEATDTSGSMFCTDFISGYPYPFTPAEAVGAMAMVGARTEPWHSLHGFSASLYDLKISPSMRLDQIMQQMRRHAGGGTDISAPMVWAQKNKVPVDIFRIWTDNETWAGRVHPWEALKNYRQAMGIDARLQVAAIAPTRFSVADPDDPRQLDVSGFDSAVPKLLADHGRGDL